LRRNVKHHHLIVPKAPVAGKDTAPFAARRTKASPGTASRQDASTATLFVSPLSAHRRNSERLIDISSH